MKKDLLKFKRYINMYKSICGVIKESDVLKIVKFYNLKLTDKEIKDSCMEVLDYKNGYYYFSDELIDDEYLNKRDDLSIRLLSDAEINKYWLNLTMIPFKIGEVIDDLKLADKLLNYELAYKWFSKKDDISSPALEHFKLKMNKYNKIVEIFDNYREIIRYWDYYGRTEEEIETDNLYNEMALKEKPKDNTLDECLNMLDKDSLERIYEFYEFDSLTELKNEIIEGFSDEVYELTKDEYNAYNGCDFSYVLSSYDYLSGFVFGYIDNGVRKIIVPKELKDMLKKVNYDKLESGFDYSDLNNIFKEIVQGLENDLSDTDLVMGYLTINGIISKEKLMKMIENNHDINLTYDDIDEIINDFYVNTIEDKYYSLIGKFDALELLSIKSKSDDYKVLTKDMVNLENEFIDELKDFIDNNWNDCDTGKSIKSFIFESIKYGVFNIDTLKMLSDEVSLNKEEIKLIEDFINKYKNDVAVWTLNGYCLSDRKSSKVEKVGRNDPCPCGSGEKYKNCCGRNQ